MEQEVSLGGEGYVRDPIADNVDRPTESLAGLHTTLHHQTDNVERMFRILSSPVVVTALKCITVVSIAGGICITVWYYRWKTLREVKAQQKEITKLLQQAKQMRMDRMQKYTELANLIDQAFKTLTEQIKQSMKLPEELKMKIGSIMFCMGCTLFWRLI